MQPARFSFLPAIFGSLCVLSNAAHAQPVVPESATGPEPPAPAEPSPPASAGEGGWTGAQPAEVSSGLPPGHSGTPVAQGEQPMGGVVTSPEPICLLGVGRGDANAETAAALICEKLRESGVVVRTVDDEIAAPAAYRVNLRPLGSLYYLELVKEEPLGQVVASRRLKLGGLEQVPAASERLVDALVRDVPVEETANARTLVAQETRAPDLRSNQTRFAFGIAGVMVGTDVGYGADMAFGFLGSEYGAQIRGRAAGGDAVHLSLVVSGWRYFGNGDIAPLLGVGFGLARLANDDQYAGGGLVLEPTIGVEFFRFDHSRLQVMAQLDVPVFHLERSVYDFAGGVRTDESRYLLGGALSVAYVF